MLLLQQIYVYRRRQYIAQCGLRCCYYSRSVCIASNSILSNVDFYVAITADLCVQPQTLYCPMWITMLLLQQICVYSLRQYIVQCGLLCCYYSRYVCIASNIILSNVDYYVAITADLRVQPQTVYCPILITMLLLQQICMYSLKQYIVQCGLLCCYYSRSVCIASYSICPMWIMMLLLQQIFVYSLKQHIVQCVCYPVSCYGHVSRLGII